MLTGRQMLTAIAATTVGLTVVMLPGVPAFAGGGAVPNTCQPDYTYVYGSVYSNNVDMVPPASAPSGHTLSIQISAGLSITGTVEGQVSGDLSAIVVGAQASVSASISYTLSASVTYGDSWTVPRSVSVGYLHAGAAHDHMIWRFGHTSGNCQTWIVDRSGTANLPYRIPAFWSTTA
jgi:hypothetical protein